MNIVFFTYSRQGCNTVRRIRECFAYDNQKAYTMDRFKDTDFLPIEDFSKTLYKDLFSWADAMIFVSSCGIAVRKIAPYINDKSTDPAVICVDDSGKYVIPVLSGHIGGANDLARKIADKLCAAAVITTATDINNRFAVDSWAAKQGFVIDDMTLAKDVSAEILERDVPVVCDFCTLSDYPKGLKAGKNGRIGIYIGWNKKTPFEKTLRIIPPVLHLGIGCRRGTKAESIRSAVNEILNAYDIDKRAIKYVASINLKSKEDGLLEYCRENGWEIYFYTADELQSLQGDFTASSFVREITGIDNVCERAAMMGAKSLIVKKTAVNGVTAAVAAENTEVRFE